MSKPASPEDQSTNPSSLRPEPASSARQTYTARPATRSQRLYYSLIALALAVTILTFVLTAAVLYHYGFLEWLGDFLFLLFSLGSFALLEWVMALPVLVFSVPRSPLAQRFYVAAACSIAPLLFLAMRLAARSPYNPLAISSPRRVFLTAALISLLTALLYKALAPRIQSSETK